MGRLRCAQLTDMPVLPDFIAACIAGQIAGTACWAVDALRADRPGQLTAAGATQYRCELKAMMARVARSALSLSSVVLVRLGSSYLRPHRELIPCSECTR